MLKVTKFSHGNYSVSTRKL